MTTETTTALALPAQTDLAVAMIARPDLIADALVAGKIPHCTVNM